MLEHVKPGILSEAGCSACGTSCKVEG